MAAITVNSISLNCTPSGSLIATVEYRESGDIPWIEVINNAVVLTDGTFSPEVVISGLDTDTCYDVRVTLECGSGFVETFCIGAGTTTSTTTTSTTTTTTVPVCDDIESLDVSSVEV